MKLAGDRPQIYRGFHASRAIAGMIGSMGLLGIAVRNLPIGSAYAVWTGIGTLGAAIIGIFWVGESASLPRLLCLLLIVIGIFGLKLTTQH